VHINLTHAIVLMEPAVRGAANPGRQRDRAALIDAGGVEVSV